MKLVRYRSATGEKPGLILDGEVFDLSGSFSTLNPRPPTLDDIEAIAAIPAKALRTMGKGLALGPPLRGIGKIIGVGLNYRDHAEESGCEEGVAYRETHGEARRADVACCG